MKRATIISAHADSDILSDIGLDMMVLVAIDIDDDIAPMLSCSHDHQTLIDEVKALGYTVVPYDRVFERVGDDGWVKWAKK